MGVLGRPAESAWSVGFTSKERDAETGLDYFGVRYMSSAQGRFTSPDPLVWQSWQSGNKEEQAKFQEFISDPQNFNLYTYGRNNPLKYNDPTGLDVEVAISFVGDVSDEEKKRIIWSSPGIPRGQEGW
jgi:RHS repeat-associated protein